MTVAAAATKAITGSTARGPRLATPGAVLLLAGLALMWWGLGVFRGEVSGGLFSSTSKRVFTMPPKATLPNEDDSIRGGAGGAKLT